MMQAQVFWIETPRHGRLGILTRPRGDDWLRDETTAWREAGIDLVISLLEPAESTQLGLEDETVAAEFSGVIFRVFPIPDRGVPESREAVAALIDDVVAALEEGRTVAVHCRQGLGRSGLIAAGVLVARGMDLPEVLNAVSHARGVEVPETDEQREWLKGFASWLRK